MILLFRVLRGVLIGFWGPLIYREELQEEQGQTGKQEGLLHPAGGHDHFPGS